MTRKICIVSGTRAESGLLKWLMHDIRNESSLELQTVVTGMHLSPEFGLTYQEIERDGFTIDRKIETLLSSDSPAGLAKSMGLGLIGFGEVLEQLKPDLMVVLGDRFEIFAAVAAAMVARIPVAHLHGGETTEGSFDEAIRHSITKMSHLHFVAAEDYRRRVIRLGEDPERVFTVGSLGVDAVQRLRLLDKAELEQALDFELGTRNLLITFHPVTLESDTIHQMSELLAALDTLKDTRLIFTMPNSDPEGRSLAHMIENFVSSRPCARAYVSLGQLRYLSCIRHVDAVVGNSSSGLIEVPALKKGTINVGDRQRGRLKAQSVIDCKPDRSSIAAAIAQLYSPTFQSGLREVLNPYGSGGASGKILNVIKSIPLTSIVKKRFYEENAQN